jgi:Uma2 family endonuclease
MPEGALKLATWEDLAKLPEGDRTEVISGMFCMSPSPLPRHGRLQGTLSAAVGAPFDYDPAGPGGWWILLEIDIELTRHDIVRPDLSGWRRERLPKFPEERPIALVPDWVCEIASPSSVRMDRIVKPALYLKSGVPFFWAVNPEERILQAFGNNGEKWLLLGTWGEGDQARIPPFEAIEIDVTRLFPPG